MYRISEPQPGNRSQKFLLVDDGVLYAEYDTKEEAEADKQKLEAADVKTDVVEEEVDVCVERIMNRLGCDVHTARVLIRQSM